MSDHTVTLEIDGQSATAVLAARKLLINALREDFGVTAPHIGCETGRCGACTVLLDGHAVKACMVLAVQAAGTRVTTASGLSHGADLSPLQSAFQEHHALQCGYCTPGMLCAAADLLKNNPCPSEQEVREGLRGNLCRCTGYQHIVDAVLAAAAARLTEMA